MDGVKAKDGASKGPKALGTWKSPLLELVTPIGTPYSDILAMFCIEVIFQQMSLFKNIKRGQELF